MDLKIITGLEKPLTKLIETISEGLGVVGNDLFKFDAKKIKRIGEAEAEAEKTKIIRRAEGEDEALKILTRASKRFALEQYNKQINLENVIVKSKEFLPKRVNSNPVDSDWSARFISIAQEVSKEDVQELLAKILAQEVAKPNTYSLRTLELIRNLSRNELQKFQKFIGLSYSGGFLLPGMPKNEVLKKYELVFNDFIQLADIGLFHSSADLNLQLDLKPNRPLLLPVATERLFVSIREEKTVRLPVLKFTEIGSQICRLLYAPAGKSVLSSYIADYKDFLVSQGLAISKN